MKKILMMLLMCIIVGCGMFSESNDSNDDKQKSTPKPTPAEKVITVKHDIKEVVKEMKASPVVRDVKHELITTEKYDNYNLVEPKLIPSLDIHILEAEKVLHEREEVSQKKIVELTAVVKELNDEDTKGFKELLRYIIYVSTIGFFLGIICTYFSKHMISVSIISAICITLAFGMLKALAFIWIIGSLSVITGLGCMIYYVVHTVQKRKETK